MEGKLQDDEHLGQQEEDGERSELYTHHNIASVAQQEEEGEMSELYTHHNIAPVAQQEEQPHQARPGVHCRVHPGPRARVERQRRRDARESKCTYSLQILLT
jgi:hypothetical protein